MTAQDIDALIEGEATTDIKELALHSRDTSLFKVMPEMVIYPKVVNDITLLVRYANEHNGISLTARAGGTCMTGGPLTESLVMNFTKYFNTFSVDALKLEADVTPGLYYRDFEKETEKYEVEMPSFPASKSICALGGMIMNNSGGEKSLRYGQTRNYIKSMHMVLSDGNEYEIKKLSKEELDEKKKKQDFEGAMYSRLHKLIDDNYDLIQSQKPKVSKNSAGYYLWDVLNRETGEFDLTQLFAGSQGTLGVLTKAKLRLVKKKKYERLIVLNFKDWMALPEVVNELLPIEPEGLETFDDVTLKLGLRFMPQVAKRVGENFFRFAIRFLPEVLIGIRMLGLPKLLVLVQLSEDSEELLEEKTEKVIETLKDNKVWVRVTRSKKDAEKYWVMRRESFRLLREHATGQTAISLVEDFCVKPEYIPAFLPKAIALLEMNGIQTNITGHAGSGNLHIIPLVDMKEEGMPEKLLKVADMFYTLVSEYHGSITAEHNDGILRTPYLGKMYSKEMLALFKEVKHICDPRGIFNPGKKVGGTLAYMKSHIAQE
jgi:FAD/FMN-containing dehydrogenase